MKSCIFFDLYIDIENDFIIPLKQYIFPLFKFVIFVFLISRKIESNIFSDFIFISELIYEKFKNKVFNIIGFSIF